ncbi:hypothetical protein AX16_000450 [Volvariella volvacea WC 439]|nr:hypothetical protein AX16_000450 [Volvariella volvacea WC 439]
MSDEWDHEHIDESHQHTAPTDDESEALQDLLNTLFSLQSGGSSTTSHSIRLAGVSLQDLGRLLASSGLMGRQVSVQIDEDEGDDDNGDDGDDDGQDDDFQDEYYPRRNPHRFAPVTEPQEAGVSLILSGDFGRIGPKIRARTGNPNLAKQLLNRATKPYHVLPKEDTTSDLVPNSNGITVSEYDSNIYTGQFSADSSFYYTCSQDFRLHIFDTNSSPHPSEFRTQSQYRSGMGFESYMKVMKSIIGHPGRWTITDANLSPDNQRIIYSSITPVVYMATTLDGSTTQTPIRFTDRRRDDYWESFGIWSCRFSADGNEVIAGGNGNIFVYDLLADRRTVRIKAHEDDVNSCCWADTSGNVLVSASDDTFLKVWDRRSLGASRRPSGVLIGHTEGITYVSAKGDGRYVISNGKDQALRLWDLRKMCTHTEYESVKHETYGVSGFDYRYPHYPRPRYLAHPNDCSVMTYRGHAVLQTLIRCHFSPAETTGGQYIYSGSSDGRIHIWSLDGRVVQVLDRSRTVPLGHNPENYVPSARQRRHAEACVRDVSWHSQEPILLSAGWESNHGGSTVVRHEWEGLSKSRGSIEDWVMKHRLEADELNKLKSWHHERVAMMSDED